MNPGMPVEQAQFMAEHRLAGRTRGRMFVVESELGALRRAVLIHGFPDTWWTWRHVIQHLLQAGVDVRAVDLPGFGRSTLVRRPEEVNVLGRVLPELCRYVEAQEAEQVLLVGHDIGALLAWMVAARTSVQGLLVFTVGHPDAALAPLRPPTEYLRAWHWGAMSLPYPAPELALRAERWRLFCRIVSDHPETERWIRELQRPGALRSALSWFRGNRRDFLWLPKISGPGCPTMGVLTEGDLRYVSRRSMAASGRFMGGQAFVLRELAGLSHWPMLDDPGRMATLLDEFLAFVENRPEDPITARSSGG